jgi:hypothetical protein
MLDNDIYNINQEFDYSTIKYIVVKSLENIVKQEALKKRSNIYDDVVFNSEGIDDPKSVNNLLPPPTTPLLKLKVRNTTQYLNWRIAVLKRDDFKCQICYTSMKDNKSLRLEVHHAKAFNDICIVEKSNNTILKSKSVLLSWIYFQ